LRVKYRMPHAKHNKTNEPPKTRGLCADNQISCGIFDVSEDKAAPMPNVIITAGRVQHISVERLVTKAMVIANLALLILSLKSQKAV